MNNAKSKPNFKNFVVCPHIYFEALANVNSNKLYGWDAQFYESVRGKKWLTHKQALQIERIVEEQLGKRAAKTLRHDVGIATMKKRPNKDIRVARSRHWHLNQQMDSAIERSL